MAIQGIGSHMGTDDKMQKKTDRHKTSVNSQRRFEEDRITAAVTRAHC